MSGSEEVTTWHATLSKCYAVASGSKNKPGTTQTSVLLHVFRIVRDYFGSKNSSVAQQQVCTERASAVHLRLQGEGHSSEDRQDRWFGRGEEEAVYVQLEKPSLTGMRWNKTTFVFNLTCCLGNDPQVV